jgi:threonine/homoserine/homoserine lactone efflux protein
MEYLVSLMVFTFVASVTPGPNNIMLFASGINHGVKKSLPHYFGICLG